MKAYKIKNYGCHDMTEGVFSLNNEQYEFLKNIFEKLNSQSEYECMPTIYIEPKEDDHEPNKLP